MREGAACDLERATGFLAVFALVSRELSLCSCSIPCVDSGLAHPHHRITTSQTEANLLDLLI